MPGLEEERQISTGAKFARTIGEMFWVLVIGVVLVYAFFLVLGAFSPGDLAPVSVAVAVLAVLYGFRSWWQSRHAGEGRDPRLMQARERRGF